MVIDGGHLANRHGLSPQERLVDGQGERPSEETVGGYAVALGKDDKVTTDISSGDVPPFAVADHEGARGRQIAQGFERALCAGDPVWLAHNAALTRGGAMKGVA